MSDETKERKDALSDKGLSPGGTKGTSKDKGKTYTDADIVKIQNDAKAEAGRLQKAAEVERDSLKQDLQTANSRLDTLEKERDESRLAEVRGDPEQLRSYQREQTATKREREMADKERDLANREEQLKTDRAGVDKDRHVVSVAYLAAKHGLETEELESLGISDPDTLERVAEKLAGAKPKETEPVLEEGETPSGEAQEFNHDSGETTGGVAGALTVESVEKSSVASVEKALEKPS